MGGVELLQGLIKSNGGRRMKHNIYIVDKFLLVLGAHAHVGLHQIACYGLYLTPEFRIILHDQIIQL